MSFVRKTKSTSSPSSAAGAQSQGTRASPTGGPHLVSSGCADLDKLLGGGIPLGTLTIFTQDGWTRHDALFLKYFVSEAVAVGQSVGVVRHMNQPCTSVADFLLRRMSRSEALKEEELEKAAVAAARDATKLRIAWQYEKYTKTTQAGGGPDTSGHARRPALGKGGPFIGSRGPWCHDHDISKPPSEEEVQRMLHPTKTGDVNEQVLETYTIRAGNDIVAQITGAVRSFASEVSKRPGVVGRLVIPALGDATWNIEADAIINALMFVRSFIQQEPRISVMVSIPLRAMRPSDAMRIMYVGDACFSLAAVEDTSSLATLSADSKSVSGAMEIIRLPTFGSTRSPLPDVRSYVVRNKRRRLALEVFEVDPDAEAEANGEPVASPSSLEW